MKIKTTTLIMFSFILIALISSGCVTDDAGNQNSQSSSGKQLSDSQNNQLFKKECPNCGGTLKIVGSMSYETKNGMILVKNGNFECPNCGSKYSCNNFTCYKT
ncbi:MAG TPA: YgiT-type zinc finger protein [Methanobacterium subterraneum]|uniref:YgiT-type zinc finger protein n=1 Tax=Methanobacterium subterraneum TaxID=59277 RepID=A0A7J4TI31_9EURY|nr:YgiT-type zinc finger protein [Methanobacterium subterraneum]